MIYVYLMLMSFLQDENKIVSAVKLSKQQQILTHQLSKEYSFIIAGIYFKTNRKYFSETKELFEENISDLINGNNDKNIPIPINFDIISHLESVMSIWDDLEGEFDSTDYRKIKRLSDKLVETFKKIELIYIEEIVKKQQLMHYDIY